jgi:tetratricopeptide (TPR) repeat protein
MAFIHFLKFQRSLFLDEVEQCLQLNPNNAHFVAVLSLHATMVGDWDRAMKLMGKAMRLNPHHLGWYHIVAFMNYYRQGEYDLALIEARRFNTPEFFWDPLIWDAVLGELDRRTEAEKAVNELLALAPNFNLRERSLIRCLAYLDEHGDILWDGLFKAGMEELEQNARIQPTGFFRFADMKYSDESSRIVNFGQLRYHRSTISYRSLRLYKSSANKTMRLCI